MVDRKSSSSSVEKIDPETAPVSKQISDIETRNPLDLPAISRATQWKIDLRLVPFLAFLYALSLVDRINISIARVAGMDAALGLTIGNRYSVIALVLFPSYLLMEIPANALFKRTGISPAWWIGGSSILFGGITMVQAAVKDWGALAGLRVILGGAEGIFFPACILLISSWYPRYQTGKRICLFYVGGLFFGGGIMQIFAYLFGLQSTASVAGWQFIFIIFGTITIVSALIGCFFAIPQFPTSDRGNKHLTTEELELVRRRIDIDRHDQVIEKLTMKDVVHQVMSLRGWSASFMFCLSNTPTYAFAYFLPSILRSTLGYSAKDAQILAAPPYLVAATFGYLVSIASDKTRQRGIYILAGSLISLAGLIMVGYSTNVNVRYAGCYVALMGCVAANPLIITWASNNVRTINGRTVNHAQVALGGNLGGIIASLVFRTQDAPGYVPGLLTCLIAEALVVVISAWLIIYYRFANHRAERNGIVIEGHPTFRYTL